MSSQHVIPRSGVCLLGFLALTLLASPVVAQVFESGPSDSALFDTVINLPADPNLAPNPAVGGDGLTTQLNILDGTTIGANLSAFAGSEVNISGGSVGFNFSAFSGSEINISGGSFGDSDASPGSVVSISGGSFDASLDAEVGSVVDISGGSVTGNFNAEVGSVVNVSGGSFGTFFDAENGSVVNISGGTFGDRFDAGVGTTGEITVIDQNGNSFSSLASGGALNITGGSFGDDFDAFLGFEVNIDGGSFGDRFSVGRSDFFSIGDNGVSISGGSFGKNFQLLDESDVSISGGNFGDAFEASSGSNVELVGGEFQLNGAAFSGSVISLNTGDVFTGTLADGSTFVFSDDSGDVLADVQITSAALPALDLSPIFVSTADSVLVSGLRSAQTLTLLDGGELGDNFEVVNALFNVEGGQLGNGASVINSIFNLSGGSVGDNFEALTGSVVNISGGLIGDDFDALAGSQINLFGSSFVLDGLLLDDSLTVNDAFEIFERAVTLSGLLADGSAFSFDLNSVDTHEDFFSSGATLTVTLVSAVPEPGSLTLIGLGGLMLVGRRRRP